MNQRHWVLIIRQKRGIIQATIEESWTIQLNDHTPLWFNWNDRQSLSLVNSFQFLIYWSLKYLVWSICSYDGVKIVEVVKCVGVLLWNSWWSTWWAWQKCISIFPCRLVSLLSLQYHINLSDDRLVFLFRNKYYYLGISNFFGISLLTRYWNIKFVIKICMYMSKTCQELMKILTNINKVVCNIS